VKGINELIRRGAIAEVGHIPFSVYLVLRNFVWRSTSKGVPALRKARAKGQVISKISYPKIQELTSLSIGSVRKAITTLVDRGWVQIESSGGRGTSYLLGVIENHSETFFADDETVTRDHSQKSETVTRDQSQVGIGCHERSVSKSETVTRDQLRLSRGDTIIHKESVKEENYITAKKTRKRSTNSSRYSDPKQESRNNDRRTWVNLDPPEPARVSRKKSSVVDEESNRRISPDELRHLNSARVKKRAGRIGDYTGDEMVAAWRLMFSKAFRIEDSTLDTAKARKRAAQMIIARATDWHSGNRAQLFDYLRSQIGLWANKEPGAKFPAGSFPKLNMLLKQDHNGRSWWWDEWASKKKRGIKA